MVNYHDGRAEHHLRDWRSAVSTLRRADAIVVPSPILVEVFGRFGLKAEAIPNADRSERHFLIANGETSTALV